MARIQVDRSFDRDIKIPDGRLVLSSANCDAPSTSQQSAPLRRGSCAIIAQVTSTQPDGRHSSTTEIYRLCGSRVRGNGTIVNNGAFWNSAAAISSIITSSLAQTLRLVSSWPQRRFCAHSKSSRATAKSLCMATPRVSTALVSSPHLVARLLI